ncbi:MAG: amino acid ABC transporter substrate-binding protein [Thiotrichales bacterium]|nr:MAG: amino acid ABC transporter substrate-binding protein [Thiotrichales bacterium]
MKVVMVVWLLLICSNAAIAAPESSFPDIQRILDSGKLRVAILAVDAPPMIITDRNGKLTGSEVDLALDIGSKLGVDVEFVRTAETYDGVVGVVARGEADLGVSFLSSGVQRAKWVLFSQPYVTQNRRVIFNRAHFTRLRRDLRIASIAELAQTEAAATLEFGVLADSINEWMLERIFPQFAVKRYDSLPDMVTDVKEGDIFAGLHGELQIEYYMRRNPETAIHVALEPRARHPSDISIAVRPDAPNLLQWVNVYLANHVGLLESEEIVERYIKIPMESR